MAISIHLRKICLTKASSYLKRHALHLTLLQSQAAFDPISKILLLREQRPIGLTTFHFAEIFQFSIQATSTLALFNHGVALDHFAGGGEDASLDEDTKGMQAAFFIMEGYLQKSLSL